MIPWDKWDSADLGGHPGLSAHMLAESGSNIDGDRNGSGFAGCERLTAHCGRRGSQ